MKSNSTLSVCTRARWIVERNDGLVLAPTRLVNLMTADLRARESMAHSLGETMPRREPANQKAYEGIKAALLGGDLAYGKLEIQKLADRFRVSQTPVREALARLATEQLIECYAWHGYAATPPSAAILADLYRWSQDLMLLALRTVIARHADATMPEPIWRPVLMSNKTAYAHRVSCFLHDLVKAQGNGELISKVSQSNDRLFRPRCCEPLFFNDCNEEIDNLKAIWRSGQTGPLRSSLKAFHDRRFGLAEVIAQRLALEIGTDA